MLQQTQVRTVIAYFERFVAALPTLDALAEAPLDRVLALWSGLGYYSRARNLHRAAQICVEQHGGELPRDFDALAALPGIGRSTAAAILAQAFGLRHAILDGNVRRVLARWHGVRGWPGATVRAACSSGHSPKRTRRTTRVADYTQAIMDLGATVCVRSRPLCAACPVSTRLRRAPRQTRRPSCRRRSQCARSPTRETTMLIVRDAARPRAARTASADRHLGCGSGALPETHDARSALRRAARALCRARRVVRAALAAFRAQLQPLSSARDAAARRRHARSARVADDARRGWFAREDLHALGLPAPVRRLLQTVFEDEKWPEPCTA